MKLIDILIESMMNGDAFKAFTDAAIENAPSNIIENNFEEKDICSIMTITNNQIDPKETNINIDNKDINEIIKVIEQKIKDKKIDSKTMKNIKQQLGDIKQEMKKLSSDNDVINTNLRQIQNLICK